MSIQEGKKAPSFTAIDPDGKKIKLADLNEYETAFVYS